MRRRPRPDGWPQPRTGRLDITGELPSNIPGHPFDFHLASAWEELPSARPHHDPRSAALDHALTVAANITATRPLSDHVAAQARINTLLGTPLTIPRLPVRLLWAQAQITAQPQHLAAVSAYQRQQYEEDLHDQHIRRRQQRAQDLYNALRTTPALVLAHWFTDHPDTLDQLTLDRIEHFITTTTTYAPDTAWVQVARLLQDFVCGLPADARQHLIASLAQLFDRYGHPDRAAQLRIIGGELQRPSGPDLHQRPEPLQ